MDNLHKIDTIKHVIYFRKKRGDSCNIAKIVSFVIKFYKMHFSAILFIQKFQRIYNEIKFSVKKNNYF
jgi:hypothetical protein